MSARKGEGGAPARVLVLGAMGRMGERVRAALRAGGVDLVFADGLSTVFWVNGAGSRGCCKLAGRGFMEPRYFGQGLAIAVKRGNDRLVRVLNYALARLRTSGQLEELMLRYFPLSLY